MPTVETLYIGVKSRYFGGCAGYHPEFAWKSYMKQCNIAKYFMRQTFLGQIFCSSWLLFNYLFFVRFMFFHFRVILIVWVRHIYTNVETSVSECPIFFGFCSSFQHTKNILGCGCTLSSYTTTAIVPKVCNIIKHEMLKKHDELQYNVKQYLI